MRAASDDVFALLQVMKIEGSVLEYAIQPSTGAATSGVESDDGLQLDNKASLCSVYVGLCHEIASAVYLRHEPDKHRFKSRHNMDFTFEQVEPQLATVLFTSTAVFITECIVM